MAKVNCLFCMSLIALSVANIYGGLPEVPFESLDTLFDVEDRVRINTISDPTRIYRKDLREDYVAYWSYVINNDEQLIISSGPNTGDYKLVFQGPLPAMTKLLDHTARETGMKCEKYFMLSPEITMMCENTEGRVIATTRDSYIKQEENDTTLRYHFVEQNLNILKEEWKRRSDEVKQDGIWDDVEFIPKDNLSGRSENKLEEGGLLILHPGQVIRIPVTGKNEKMKLSVEGNGGHKLCKLLKICTADNRGVIDTSYLEKTAYGIPYVPFRIPESLSGKDIRFDLEIFTETGLYTKRFYVDLNRRGKRGATYTAWSTVEIGHEIVFPDYNQFTFGNCQVGCGPVAWGMIFGYYDQRSHLSPGTYGTGSQNLFRCGGDGTTGDNSCVAPSTTLTNMENYIKNLHGILKTFCLAGQGATLQGRMDRVEGFFRDRQPTGSPDIISHRRIFSFFGLYSKSVRDKGLAALRAGWPIIPGIRVSGLFSQHYPVATRYRSRVKSERKCFLWRCRTKRTTQYEMYLHMGWGGNQNGWRSAKMFFVTYARY